jgi:hypothetical protein
VDSAALKTLHFRFAKTMAHVPHEYVVRSPQNEEIYVALFKAVQESGVLERFGRRRYRYWYPGDGYKYWVMADNMADSQVINRTKVDDSKLPDNERF